MKDLTLIITSPILQVVVLGCIMYDWTEGLKDV